MDYSEFVSKPKSIIIAPAGHGKTYAIAQCLKITAGRQLVLTHTHAGVAAIKEKIKALGIPSQRYSVDTITSFAQKYVKAFYCNKDVPEQDNGAAYYPFIIDRACVLLRVAPIKDVVRATYAGLFIDEYQDCTSSQHALVLALSSILPTHIFGDPLQGIFSFGGQNLVNFDRDLADFEKFPDLPVPWRWKDKNPELGKSLKEIRLKLEGEEDINLNDWAAHIKVIQATEMDKFAHGSAYNKEIWALVKEPNVLIIHPDSASFGGRKKIVISFSNAFSIVEAIDEADFYKYAKKLDVATNKTVYRVIHEIICDIFNTTELNTWFNATGVKNKHSEEDKTVIKEIKNNIERLGQTLSFFTVSDTFKKIKQLPKIKCYRRELLSDLCQALEQAQFSKKAVYEEMKTIKNVRRRTGKRIHGRCIGTTLLTKGLEFDTVAIMDAHKFKCPKNFYVAITRACKKLIIFTNNKILSPYYRKPQV